MQGLINCLIRKKARSRTCRVVADLDLIERFKKNIYVINCVSPFCLMSDIRPLDVVDAAAVAAVVVYLLYATQG